MNLSTVRISISDKERLPHNEINCLNENPIESIYFFNLIGLQYSRYSSLNFERVILFLSVVILEHHDSIDDSIGREIESITPEGTSEESLS